MPLVARQVNALVLPVADDAGEVPEYPPWLAFDLGDDAGEEGISFARCIPLRRRRGGLLVAVPTAAILPSTAPTSATPQGPSADQH